MPRGRSDRDSKRREVDGRSTAKLFISPLNSYGESDARWEKHSQKWTRSGSTREASELPTSEWRNECHTTTPICRRSRPNHWTLVLPTFDAPPEPLAPGSAFYRLEARLRNVNCCMRQLHRGLLPLRALVDVEETSWTVFRWPSHPLPFSVTSTCGSLYLVIFAKGPLLCVT